MLAIDHAGPLETACLEPAHLDLQALRQFGPNPRAQLGIKDHVRMLKDHAGIVDHLRQGLCRLANPCLDMVCHCSQVPVRYRPFSLRKAGGDEPGAQGEERGDLVRQLRRATVYVDKARAQIGGVAGRAFPQHPIAHHAGQQQLRNHQKYDIGRSRRRQRNQFGPASGIAVIDLGDLEPAAPR